MSRVYRFPDKERRKDESRLLWISPPDPGMLAGCSGYIERRTDRDGAEAAIHLSKMLMLGDASGLLFAVVRGNGRIEVGISGCLYDSPMIAAGIASQALSVASHWHFDPGNYITDET